MICVVRCFFFFTLVIVLLACLRACVLVGVGRNGTLEYAGLIIICFYVCQSEIRLFFMTVNKLISIPTNVCKGSNIVLCRVLLLYR